MAMLRGPAASQCKWVITALTAASSGGLKIAGINLGMQVPEQRQHLSCCAVIRGFSVNLFFVPQKGAMPAASNPQLTSLEHEAQSNPAAKPHLLRFLHVSCYRSGKQ